MESYTEALTYPIDREDWVRTILIGGILMFFGFLIIPLVLINGYGIRVIRTRLEGRSDPPVFDDWESLFVDGLKAFVIGLVYMIVPIVVGAATVGTAFVAMAGSPRMGAAALTGMVGGLGITFLLFLVFGYVAVAAVINFAAEEDFSAGFAFEDIKELGMNPEYAVAWGISVVVLLVANVVSGALNVIPLLGAVAAAFVYFYAEVVAADIWVEGYERATTDRDADVSLR
ncbi:MAG: DUF4013 domain-containing protein [Halodesulfurarchaeum sp.]